MKEICIDVRMALNSGIGTYIRNIVSRLLKGPFNLKLIAHQELIQKWPALSSFNVLLTSAPLYSVQEQIALPLLVPKCDLFWTPHFNIPLAGVRANKRMITLHDVYHLAFGENLSWPKRLYAKTVISRAVKISDHILTVSHFSKREILKYTRCLPDKISVVHLGVDASLFSEADPGRLQMKYQLPEHYFIFVSTLAPHKNIDRLLKAWNILMRELPDWKLIVVGKKVKVNTWQPVLEQYPSLKQQVVFLEHVDNQDLPALYRFADAAVHPSLYEGFGLTPLEAMSCGCPTIVSNAASIPEVCGDSTLYVDPYDIHDIAAGMRKIAQNPALRADLKEKGLKRSQLFTWDKTVQDHIEILERLT